MSFNDAKYQKALLTLTQQLALKVQEDCDKGAEKDEAMAQHMEDVVQDIQNQLLLMLT